MKALMSIVLNVISVAAIAATAGSAAPQFSAKNQDGKVITLNDYKGKFVVLYFYPKDETPGCTKEACSFRDQYKEFEKQGAVVIGVSVQDAKSHRSFKNNHHLPFDLIVDSDGSIAKSFGVERYPAIGLLKRQSVLIDRDGKILKFYEDVNPDTHTAEVLKDIQSAKK